ncbi:MAG: ATP synthase F1 subunit delta [Verrucomicrobia bacterium]|nr:ATP synthase F1 subunit delta [Verrucomicrobiota bacterium]
MPHDPINTGYARALFEMASAEGVTDRIQEELFRLRELLKANPALLEFLKDPNIKREGKRQALTELLDGRIHPVLLNTILTLSDQDRAGRILPIVEEFDRVASAARQKITGEVTTAIKLDDATLARLAGELSRLTGKNVQLFQRIDPAILGGAVIKVGEQIIDASLRRKLDQIKTILAQ